MPRTTLRNPGVRLSNDGSIGAITSNCDVALRYGGPVFVSIRVTPNQARLLAAELIASADHIDAETQSLARGTA